MALSANSLQDDAIVGNGRIIGCPPGIMGEPFRDAVRVTRRWNHGALHDSLTAFPDNVVMTYYGVDRDVAWRSGGRRLGSRTRSGAITVIPEGHDGRWDMDGPVETSHVYIPDRRLQAAAAQITGGGRVELVGRVGFEDPSAARILELLSREVPNQEPSARLFVDQAIDLSPRAGPQQLRCSSAGSAPRRLGRLATAARHAIYARTSCQGDRARRTRGARESEPVSFLHRLSKSDGSNATQLAHDLAYRGSSAVIGDTCARGYRCCPCRRLPNAVVVRSRVQEIGGNDTQRIPPRTLIARPQETDPGNHSEAERKVPAHAPLEAKAT